MSRMHYAAFACNPQLPPERAAPDHADTGSSLDGSSLQPTLRTGTIGPSMRLFLIRHAQAGERSPGHHDLFRHLSPKGHRRAEAIADLLADAGITRVLSSPASRCVQTVEPLAASLGLEVEEHPDLWEGSLTHHVLALLSQENDGATAACSHGDIIPEVIEAVAAQGAHISGRGCEKGSVWILDHSGEAWTRARYLDRSHDRLPEEQH